VHITEVFTVELYTISLSQWRKARDRGITLIDITVKSGLRVFAPEDAVLWAYKRGEVSDEDYTELYLKRLQEQFRASPEVFEQFLMNEGPVAVACYCAAGKFCHRHVFVPFIKLVADDNGCPLTLCGEIL